MPSPFPGMDPWLEDRYLFPDLHDRLIVSISDAVNAALPPGYFAAIGTLVWVDDQQRSEPDVTVLRPDRRGGGGTALLDAPSRLQALGTRPEPEPREEPYLEIHAPGGERVVTAVEVLSRSNKAAGSKGREAYLAKQEEFALGGVNVVEIDLLRSGTHTTACPRRRLERLAGGPFHYHVCVTEAGTPGRLFGAVFPLSRPLPEIDIPLDRAAGRVAVALQPLLDRAYDAGRYALRAGYAKPCDPPLSPDDQSWADGVLRFRPAGGT